VIHRQRHRRALVLAATLLLAGCTDRPAQRVDSGQLVAVPKEIGTAYDAYWNAWSHASETSDPDDPDLARHVGNPHLEVLRAALESARQEHTVVHGTVGHSIRGMQNFAAAHRVVDCVDLTGWLIVDARTGQPIEQLTTRPKQLGAFTLEQAQGAWKVTHGQILGDC
jgi:hypothetical protein